ncbi:MAG: hypothetical protein OEO17_02470 [Gemmatimonadota bacterium]|nr:hypothetical protein [Gemmatimonadota bacterium]
MNENLKAKISGRLDALPDDIGRQVLDYLEFLDSKYNKSRRATSTVQRLAENLEDRLGTVRIADAAAKGGAQVLEAAGRLMEGLAAASRVVAEELEPATPSSGEEKAPSTDQAPPTDPGAEPQSPA